MLVEHTLFYQGLTGGTSAKRVYKAIGEEGIEVPEVDVTAGREGAWGLRVAWLGFLTLGRGLEGYVWKVGGGVSWRVKFVVVLEEIKFI